MVMQYNVGNCPIKLSFVNIFLYSSFLFLRNLAVLGAGLMGAGIAHVSIQKGFNVILKDMATQGIARGELQIEKGLNAGVKRKKMSA